MTDAKPAWDVKSTAESSEVSLLVQSEPTEWQVCINDDLPTPTYGPWVAIGLSASMAVSLIIIACHEFKLLDLGVMDPHWMDFLGTIRILIGLAATGYITGQVTILWLYDYCRPQPTEAEAKSMATLGKVLTNIAELKDKIKFWRAAAYILLAASMQAALTNAITAFPTQEPRPHSMTSLDDSYDVYKCVNISSLPPSPDDGFQWRMNDTHWITALTLNPEFDPPTCPWYSVKSIFGLSSATVDYAYSMAGVPVNRSAIGVPARLGSYSGAFEPIFGTDTFEGEKLSFLADRFTNPISGATSCLPVLTSNPVKCHSTGAVNIISGSDGDYFTFGGSTCNYPFDSDTVSHPITANMSMSRWAICNDTGPAVGQMTLSAGAIGNDAEAFATLMNDIVSNVSGISSYSLACTVNIKPSISFRELSYQPEMVNATGNTVFTVTGSDQDCQPKTNDTRQGFDTSLILNDTAMAIGASGVEDLTMENWDAGGYPSLLSQMYLKDINTLNFDNSDNSLEDSLGLAIGATLGVYWGMVLPTMIPDGYHTSVTVKYTRLGSSGYWPVLFALPFFAMTVVAFAALQTRFELDGRWKRRSHVQLIVSPPC